MATNYNITPKEFNGTDYDTLYFKNTSQQSLLNDNAFATLLGLSGTPNVNDALKAVLNSTVYVGEYVGNDDYGVNTPNILQFTFIPKLVIIGKDINDTSSTNPLGIIPYSCSIVTQDLESLPTTWNTVSDTTTVSWYSSSNSGQQLNAEGVQYHYYAFR